MALETRAIEQTEEVVVNAMKLKYTRDLDMFRKLEMLKFQANAESSAVAMTAADIDALIQLLDQLDDLPDVIGLVDRLVP